jgi:hypothetical protein
MEDMVALELMAAPLDTTAHDCEFVMSPPETIAVDTNSGLLVYTKEICISAVD